VFFIDFQNANQKKEGNQYCADCHYSGPSWASLDFGILIVL